MEKNNLNKLQVDQRLQGKIRHHRRTRRKRRKFLCNLHVEKTFELRIQKPWNTDTFHLSAWNGITHPSPSLSFSYQTTQSWRPCVGKARPASGGGGDRGPEWGVGTLAWWGGHPLIGSSAQRDTPKWGGISAGRGATGSGSENPRWVARVWVEAEEENGEHTGELIE